MNAEAMCIEYNGAKSTDEILDGYMDGVLRPLGSEYQSHLLFKSKRTVEAWKKSTYPIYFAD